MKDQEDFVDFILEDFNKMNTRYIKYRRGNYTECLNFKDMKTRTIEEVKSFAISAKERIEEAAKRFGISNQRMGRTDVTIQNNSYEVNFDSDYLLQILNLGLTLDRAFIVIENWIATTFQTFNTIVEGDKDEKFIEEFFNRPLRDRRGIQ